MEVTAEAAIDAAATIGAPVFAAAELVADTQLDAAATAPVGTAAELVPTASIDARATAPVAAVAELIAESRLAAAVVGLVFARCELGAEAAIDARAHRRRAMQVARITAGPVIRTGSITARAAMLAGGIGTVT